MTQQLAERLIALIRKRCMELPAFGVTSAQMAEINKWLGCDIRLKDAAFFKFVIPAVSIDPGYCRFLDFEELRTDNTLQWPGNLLSPIGCLVFGTAGDGAAYVYSAATAAVLLVPLGTVQKEGIETYGKPAYIPITYENLKLHAENFWANTESFVAWLAERLEKR